MTDQNTAASPIRFAYCQILSATECEQDSLVGILFQPTYCNSNVFSIRWRQYGNTAMVDEKKKTTSNGAIILSRKLKPLPLPT